MVIGEVLVELVEFHRKSNERLDRRVVHHLTHPREAPGENLDVPITAAILHVVRVRHVEPVHHPLLITPMIVSHVGEADTAGNSGVC